MIRGLRTRIGADLFVPMRIPIKHSEKEDSSNKHKMEEPMAKILCVLYGDPVDGYPKVYPRDSLPSLTSYPDGQTLPSPKNCRATINVRKQRQSV
jgi:hypothetical protein